MDATNQNKGWCSNIHAVQVRSPNRTECCQTFPVCVTRWKPTRHNQHSSTSNFLCRFNILNWIGALKVYAVITDKFKFAFTIRELPALSGHPGLPGIAATETSATISRDRGLSPRQLIAQPTLIWQEIVIIIKCSSIAPLPNVLWPLFSQASVGLVIWFSVYRL